MTTTASHTTARSLFAELGMFRIERPAHASQMFRLGFDDRQIVALIGHSDDVTLQYCDKAGAICSEIVIPAPDGCLSKINTVAIEAILNAWKA